MLVLWAWQTKSISLVDSWAMLCMIVAQPASNATTLKPTRGPSTTTIRRKCGNTRASPCIYRAVETICKSSDSETLCILLLYSTKLPECKRRTFQWWSFDRLSLQFS
uniref:Secreted protein n=1 Tax=Cacopsylla melanoneura TaxID=428564 RepID=A0A8D9A6N3_9HEMI